MKSTTNQFNTTSIRWHECRFSDSALSETTVGTPATHSIQVQDESGMAAVWFYNNVICLNSPHTFTINSNPDDQ